MKSCIARLPSSQKDERGLDLRFLSQRPTGYVLYVYISLELIVHPRGISTKVQDSSSDRGQPTLGDTRRAEIHGQRFA